MKYLSLYFTPYVIFSRRNFWIGITYNDGAWIWDTDSSEATYTNWGTPSYEPDAGHIRSIDDGRWKATSSNDRYRVICERCEYLFNINIHIYSV